MAQNRRVHSITRRPAAADRTARRQFQATGQPLSRTQACDAVTSRLPRYEAKCVHSDITETELLPANILISLKRQLIALQLCIGPHSSFYFQFLHEFFLVACGRLSVLYVSFWAHVNILHRVVLVHGQVTIISVVSVCLFVCLLV